MAVKDAITKVRRSSAEPLRDQILQRCRWLLLGGHVVPGQKLPLRPLAEEFNTSLMPVRDALNRLVADGALELSSSRTIRVPNMTIERLRELHEIRRALEGLATEHATPNVTGAAIDRAEQLIGEMEDALAGDDFDRYIRSHYSFHFTIYAAANRPTLLGMIEMLWLQVGPWFRQGIERANRLKIEANSCHANVITALRARDATAARSAIELDVLDRLEDLFEDEGT